MNRYIFFDTETTGLINHKMPAGMAQPSNVHLVQLAAIMTDHYFNEIMVADLLVKPGGRYTEMPARSFEVHGFTVERLEKEGLPLETVLDFFNWMASQAQVGVCHNVEFDQKIIETEGIRTDIGAVIPDQMFCSMKSTTEICQLPGRYGYKWPTLQELHTHLFGEGFDNAHNALFDIRATIRCVKQLKANGFPGIP